MACTIASAPGGSGLHVWLAVWELAPGDSPKGVDAHVETADVVVGLPSPEFAAFPQHPPAAGACPFFQYVPRLGPVQ